MITAAKDTVTYDFVVLAPAPVVKAMSNEYAKEGEEVTITGQYFISPITIEFQGAVIEEADMKLSETAATFKIPAGTQPGVVKVTTASGTTKAPFQYRDPRGLITNFDGGTDVVPQGWNFKGEYKSEGGVDGNYVELKSANVLDESGAWNEDYKIDFWCGNWNGDPMSVTSGPGTPICYVVDFTDFKNMALKFEICIPKSNPWSSGAMQLIFTNSKNAANDSWQNNTFVHSSASDPAGLDLCRGLWRPWEATGEFHTDDKWITVTVPFSEFIYNSDGTPGLVPLERPEDFASFVIWAWSGGVNGKECNPIFRIDNIRAVSVK
jgi:hypothetical protein